MKPDRRLNKLRPAQPGGYDYSHPGIYFVTLSTFQRAEIFGGVVEGEMDCSPLGRIVRTEWFRSADDLPEIQLFKTEFVVMPNHLHGIVWIMDDNGPLPEETVRVKEFRGDGRGASLAPQRRNGRRASWVLSSFISGFKAAVSGEAGRAHDPAEIWQRNFFYHLIKNQDELDDFRVYIHTNPLHWLEDQLHPSAPPNRFKKD